MVKELFKQIFKKYQLTETELNQMVSDFMSSLLIRLITITPNLDANDFKEISDSMHAKQADQAVKIIQSKYPTGQWDKMLEEQTTTQLEEYVTTVSAKLE